MLSGNGKNRIKFDTESNLIIFFSAYCPSLLRRLDFAMAILSASDYPICCVETTYLVTNTHLTPRSSRCNVENNYQVRTKGSVTVYD